MLVARIRCPGCGITMRPANPLPVGRKIKCSRCGGIVAVTADEEPNAAPTPLVRAPRHLAVEPEEEPGFEEVPEVRPVYRAPPRKPVKSRRSNAGPIILIILAIVVLAGGGFALYYFLGPGKKHPAVAAAGMSDKSAMEDPDAWHRDRLKLIEDIVNTLGGVKDEATAQAAQRKIGGFTERTRNLTKRMYDFSSFDFRNHERGERLALKYQDDAVALTQRLIAEALRIKTVRGGPELLKALVKGLELKAELDQIAQEIKRKYPGAPAIAINPLMDVQLVIEGFGK